MTLQAPFIAAPLRPHIAEGLATLVERSRTQLTDADKRFGAQLLADAYCDLLDHCFVDLLRDIYRSHPSSLLQEAITAADGAKEKIQHYLGWVVGFFSSERLVPVVAHFNGLVHELSLQEQLQSYIAYQLSPGLTANATRALTSLRDGTAENANEAVEVLIQAVEESLEPLVLRPKHLMKFNFVVNKTLDGVITLVMALIRRTLHKLAPQLPRQVFPQVSSHLGRFLIISTTADAFIAPPSA